MAKIGLIRFTQSDTERVVKTVRKTETLSSRDLSSRKSSSVEGIAFGAIESSLVKVSFTSTEIKESAGCRC